MKGKNKTRASRKKLIFDSFFQLRIIFVFFLKFLIIVCPNRIQKSYSFYKKNYKV